MSTQLNDPNMTLWVYFWRKGWLSVIQSTGRVGKMSNFPNLPQFSQFTPITHQQSHRFARVFEILLTSDFSVLILPAPLATAPPQFWTSPGLEHFDITETLLLPEGYRFVSNGQRRYRLSTPLPEERDSLNDTCTCSILRNTETTN